jgi:phosphohistidine swiveling domain-containing protein
VAAAVDHKAHMVVEVLPLVERVVEETVLVHQQQGQPEPQIREAAAVVVDTQGLEVQVATVGLVLFIFRLHLPVLQHSPLE